MEFRILGSLEAVASGGPLRLGGRKQRALLAGLLLARGRALSRDRLGRMLWPGDPPETYQHALEVYASSLRTVFREAGEGVLLESGPAGYRLDLDTHTFDAAEFERRAAEAAGGGDLDRARTAEMRRTALALWRGQVLADMEPLPWVLEARTRLQSLRLDVHRALLQAELDMGRHAEVLAELTATAAENPLDEELQRLLMLCLYRCGRQADASGVYHALRRRLRDEVGMEPGSRIQELLVDVLRQSSELDAAAPSRGNLPVALTSFVARQEEMDGLAALVGSGRRLVTVTGAGGMGKTRLAVELARRLAGDFEAGAWLVELASLTREDHVVPAIAAVLDVHARAELPLVDQVGAALRDRRLLLVVDNCEHLLAGVAPAVAALLKVAPQLHVVATSRERLGCAGETEWRIPPLTVPAAGDTCTAADLPAYAGCALFLDRARHVHPGYAVAEADADSVATLVRRLDGMPLALELAAAQVGVLDVRSMVQRTDQALELLRGRAEMGGHAERTLAAAFEWSHRLLDVEERELFARLAVFEGSFSLESAEAVCSDGRLVRDRVGRIVAALAAKSMLMAQQAEHGMRYRLLEVLRHFAAEKLDTRRRGALDRRLATHLLDLAGDANGRVHGPGGAAWVQRAALELDNVDALLGRLRPQDPGLFCSLTLAWAPVWVAAWRFAQRSRLEEAEAVALERGDRTAGPLVAQLARITMYQGDLDASEAAVHRGLEIAASDDGMLHLRLLLSLGAVRVAQGRYEAARSIHESALALADRLAGESGPDPALMLATAVLLNNLGDTYCEEDPERAIHFATRALTLQDGLADSFLRPVSLSTIAYALIRQGRLDEARTTIVELIEAAGGNVLWVALGATVATLLLAAEHRFDAALRAYTAGECLVERLHGTLAPGTETVAADATVRRLRATLGARHCELIAAEVATMRTDELPAMLREDLNGPGLRVVAT